MYIYKVLKAQSLPRINEAADYDARPIGETLYTVGKSLTYMYFPHQCSI